MYGHIVLADTKSGFIPNTIKWITASEFSHSFVTIPDILGIPMCIEAAENGVDTTRFDTGYVDNQGEGYEVWSVNVPQDVKDAAIKSLLNDLETNYGFLQFPWFIWRAINRVFGRDIKSQNNWDTNGMICSQVCCAYLTACGLSAVFAGYGNGSICPQDLQNIFKAYPQYFQKLESVRLP